MQLAVQSSAASCAASPRLRRCSQGGWRCRAWLAELCFKQARHIFEDSLWSHSEFVQCEKILHVKQTSYTGDLSSTYLIFSMHGKDMNGGQDPSACRVKMRSAC